MHAGPKATYDTSKDEEKSYTTQDSDSTTDMDGAHDHTVHTTVADNPLAHIIGVAILEFGVILHRCFSFFFFAQGIFSFFSFLTSTAF